MGVVDGAGLKVFDVEDDSVDFDDDDSNDGDDDDINDNVK